MNEAKTPPCPKRYYPFDIYLKERFGKKGIRVPLDCGFGCPNRDGTLGYGGCIYCSDRHYGLRLPSLTEQYERQREILKRKWKKEAVWLPYIQSGCGTYSDADTLRRIYCEVLSLPDAAGIIIATRADCLSEEAVSLLREIDRKHFLIVELGMQTSNDRTLGLINRRCTNAGFLRGYESLSGLRTVVHIINGLPGETEDDMLATAGQISRMKPFGIKIHLLHVLKNTPLGEMYGRGEVGVMTLEEYVRITVRQLRILPPDTVICRLTGDGWRDELIAPEWSLHKFSVLNAIDAEMLRLGCRQGDMYSAEEGDCTK